MPQHQSNAVMHAESLMYTDRHKEEELLNLHQFTMFTLEITTM